jgi:hypothetical protein
MDERELLLSDIGEFLDILAQQDGGPLPSTGTVFEPAETPAQPLIEATNGS